MEKLTGEDLRAWLAEFDKTQAEQVEVDDVQSGLPAEAAGARLREEIEKALRLADSSDLILSDDEMRVLKALIVTAGLGKSRVMVRQIKELIRKNLARGQTGGIEFVWYLVGNMRLAEELASEYGDEAVVLRGRAHGLGDEETDAPEPLCNRAAIVAEAMKAGVQNIQRAFCRRTEKDKQGNAIEVKCPYFESCEYQAQFDKAATTAEIVFMAHEHLFLHIGKERLPKPNLTVVDESPMPSFIAKARRFTPDQVRETAGGHLPLAEIILAAFAESRDPRSALSAAGLCARDLKNAADDLDEKPEIVPGMSDDSVRKAVAAYKPSKAAILFRRVAAEFNTGVSTKLDADVIAELVADGTAIVDFLDRPLRGAYQAMVRVKVEGEEERIKQPFIFCQHRKRLSIPDDVPVVVLDATGEPEQLQAVWPGMEVTKIEAQRNVRIIQVTGLSMSHAMLKPEESGPLRAHEIADLLKWVAPRSLLVGPKSWVYTVERPTGSYADHFGNIRGTDIYKQCNSAVIVGRSLMHHADAERDARALFFDREQSLQLGVSYRPTKVAIRGTNRHVNDWRHEDKIVDMFRAQAAEKEIEQAVDRLRLIWRTRQRLVVIVGECPTSLKVWRTVRYQEFIADRVMRAYYRSGGLLVLRPEELARRFPDLWESSTAAEHSVRRLRLDNPFVRLWEFRQAGQRGRASRALADASLGPDALASRLGQEGLGASLAGLAKLP